jgi:uncharacterized membrane protein
MQNADKIRNIEIRLEQLSSDLKKYESSIRILRSELATLKTSPETEEEMTTIPDAIVPIAVQLPEPNEPKPLIEQSEPFVKPNIPKINLEEYVGGNLLSKAGIVVLVLGIGIFVKYAIDNNLINELGRVILGYLAGCGLLATAYKLKSKYHNYSAVIMSGAMAAMYFTTFSANYYYQILPREVAFALMVALTVLTVWQATRYQVEWIGIFGLVGAYAIPFLLDDHSGAVYKLFIYMTVINLGVMWLSFQQKWDWLNVVAYFFTWLIYVTWFATQYSPDKHKVIALVFLIIFFLMNYFNQIVHVFKGKLTLELFYITRLVSNNFLFFSLGLAIAQDFDKNYRGLFLLFNAIIHGAICLFLARKKLVDNWLYYLIQSFAWLAIIVIIPIQLDGHWITLVWTLGAATMYYFGRTKGISYFQNVALIILGLALVSLFGDWQAYKEVVAPFLKSLQNSTFLTTCVFVLATGFILRTNLDERHRPKPENEIQTSLTWIIAIMLIVTSYSLWVNEIAYWFVKQAVLAKNVQSFEAEMLFEHYKSACLTIYTFVFLAGLVWIVKLKLSHNFTLVYVALVVSGLGIFFWLCMPTLTDLKEDYLSEQSQATFWAILIRYLTYLAVALLVWVNFKLIQQVKTALGQLPKYFPLLVHGLILLILSSELITWIEILNQGKRVYNIHQMTQTGFSLLWGSYAFMLVLLGFRQKIKNFRIAGIALFGVVILKLFLFDLNNASPIGKIIAFIALGLLLLILSFLYQKLKDKVLEDDQQKTNLP